MSITVLQRFREGLANRRFTMTKAGDDTGIPLTTLSYMRNSDWGEGVIEKIEKLEAFLDKIDEELAAGAAPKAENETGRATTAA